MKIILRESYELLGHPGDIVEVKGGFARNFLVPNRIAYPNNKFYKRLFEQEREELFRRDAQARAEAEKVAGEATDVKIEFIVKIGDRGKMHGAITNADIAARLKETGIEVDRRKIALPQPIKTTGEHRIRVKLHADVGFDVIVTVSPETSPPEELEELEGILQEETPEDTEQSADATAEGETDLTETVTDGSVEIVEMVPAEKAESDTEEETPVMIDPSSSDSDAEDKTE